MQLEYKNSEKVRGLFTWRINSKFLSGSNLKSKLGTNLEDPKLLQKLVKNYGDKLYLTSGDENKNKFFTWFSRIKEWKNQRNVKVKYSIQPTKTYEDKENDNLIDFFDFSEKLNKKFQFKINFGFRVYETKLKINSGSIKGYNKKPFYTKDIQKLKNI